MKIADMINDKKLKEKKSNAISTNYFTNILQTTNIAWYTSVCYYNNKSDFELIIH